MSDAPDDLRPMLASLADAPLVDPHLVYEPKYDGIRAVVSIAPGGHVRLWSRLGNDKTRQFPEVAAALSTWARALRRPLVLDGELVALSDTGDPTGFQQLQGRIHVSDAAPAAGARAAFIAFDLLRDGATDLRRRPYLERRGALEALFAKRPALPLVRISDMVARDGRAMYALALARGWEGLIAKKADSPYRPGQRTTDWRKLKIVHEQEFVVGGWTEPRHTRTDFGALALGVYERGALVYVGHAGTGFDQQELACVMARLKPLETGTCPFRTRPKTNARAHWVRPELVAQVKFSEWTADRRLRHPVYLGLRDDKTPTDVRREPHQRLHGAAARRLSVPPKRAGAHEPAAAGRATLLDQLSAIEASRGKGLLTLPGGGTLPVANLHKVFWRRGALTKGDLFRYYVQVAPLILPVVADRPLVMKRFPNGVDAPPFYQHRSDGTMPGVRVETIGHERRQLVGGTLATLLYMAQLAAISQDPWFSRVGSPETADFVAFDLDPSEGVPFSRVLDVARWIHDELTRVGTRGFPKTSGADGLHVYVPLPPGTPFDAGLLFCRIVATVVATKHPQVATLERRIHARGRRVYIDCLQNAAGKTLAAAYSARASQFAGVSAPLTWTEVDEGVAPRDFTIRTAPARFAERGDLWKALRTSPGVDLSSVERYARRAAGRVGSREHR